MTEEKNLCPGSHQFVGVPIRRDGPDRRECPGCNKLVMVRRNGRLREHGIATEAQVAA